MAKFDTILRGGTIIDGLGTARFTGDVGIKDGLVAEIGNLRGATADREIDVSGKIVAPGIIDLHTHYEAQLHWDPYLTPSGWHGMTTAVVGNCGHGFAPVRAGMEERYMLMLENTEQIPYAAMAKALKWDWESFPQWLDNLRAIPKGVNVASLLPVNPLLSYVVGPDESKKRPATVEERARMREILHEAMDAGACGFGFSYLGENGNSHVDFDGTAMPCDVMAEEEAFNLCQVLRERGEGVIQVLSELPGGETRRAFTEELARRSGRPVIHTVTMSVDGAPEMHRENLRWLDKTMAEGLPIYSQGMTSRHWQEFEVRDYNVWDIYPEMRQLNATKTIEGQLALVNDPEWRKGLLGKYDRHEMAGQTGIFLEQLILIEHCGVPELAEYRDMRLQEISERRNQPITETLFDIMSLTRMGAHFCGDESGGCNDEYVAEMLHHPRILPGTSDGGAHAKFFSGGHWSTDMIIWMSRETDHFTLEECHQMLGERTADAFGFGDRGVLRQGAVADIMVYDFDRLYFKRKRYSVVHDMPDGDWRRVTKVEGIDYVFVNGTVTFEQNECTDATPGVLISNTPHDPGYALAAE
jgi:N-acyl-D-aspartate/D-glutamate deacylase